MRREMKSGSMLQWASLVLLVLGMNAFSLAQTRDAEYQKYKDEADESADAAKTFREIMDVPEKGIPDTIFDSAKCVAVFPSTIKGGFIVGARRGDGVVSCRTGTGWSAPAYLDMSGGSFGAQIGVQATDYVLMFMSDDGINSLLSGKFTIGGEVSAAAGPVGRAASASTDWKLNSQILTYSRSRGLFAGATLNGVAVTIDDSDMDKIYGSAATAREVLLDSRYTAPAVIRDFPNELANYSSKSASR